jgi:hypothetical protein
MSRYSPEVLPYGAPSPFAEALLAELAKGPERLRQMRADQAAEKERQYQARRRATTDPVEDALRRANLYEHGITPTGDQSNTGGGLPDEIAAQGGRGADLISGRAKFGDPGLGPNVRPTGGVFAPGAFNPVTGTFNPPINPDPGFTAPRIGPSRDIDPGMMAPRIGPQRDIDPGMTAPGQGRVPLGGGFQYDPDAQMRQHQRQLAGDLAIEDQMHPGPYHPHTMAEALDYERQLIEARGLAEERVQRARVAATRAAGSTHPELTSVERQIDDTRADLNSTRQSRKDIGSFPITEADSSSAADLDGRIGNLRQRLDSLNTQRDSIAARVQGRSGATGATTKTPAQWVSEVRAAHPTWTPQQIADEARRRAGARR